MSTTSNENEDTTPNDLFPFVIPIYEFNSYIIFSHLFFLLLFWPIQFFIRNQSCIVSSRFFPAYTQCRKNEEKERKLKLSNTHPFYIPLVSTTVNPINSSTRDIESDVLVNDTHSNTRETNTNIHFCILIHQNGCILVFIIINFSINILKFMRIHCK